MQLNVEVTGDAAEKIRELGAFSLESARQNLVREATILGLQAIISGNPVDTARSRAAWVQSLEELGGTAPAGWEGPHPSGVTEGRQLGKLNEQQTEGITQISASNGVDYAPFLEYGSSRMAPFAMVRSGLMAARSQLAALFHLT